MDVESATSDVEAVGVDSGAQETRPKQLKSGGTGRLPGKSAFPVARVQKILKADKELSMVAKEVVFLVSVATELFIERLALAAQIQAAREKRATIQTKDFATAVRKEGEYFFLEEIMASLPTSASVASTKKRNAATATGEEGAGPSVTIMQAFAKVGKKDPERTEVQHHAADGSEESGEEDTQEVQENPFDEAIGVEDDAVASPPISTPADRSPASTRPIDIDTDEEMGDT